MSKTACLAIWLSLLSAGPLLAQAGNQDSSSDILSKFKAQVQSRADRGIYPIPGMNPNDAREALARLKSLDKDDWAATWIEQGNRHMAVAKAAEPADRAKAREAYLTAWRMYNFGGWPARDSAGKEASYWQSVDAFRNYARLQEPAAELVQIPFENSKIVGLLRLPSGRGPHPVVLLIGGLDQYKEFGSLTLDGPLMDRGIGYLALDMPGTGESPTKLEIGAERVYSKVIDFLSARAVIDPRRIAVWGASAGGYWSALLAQIERQRLKAAVVLGAPIDHYFDAEWQRKSFGTPEYAFGLKETRMFVYGAKTEEEFFAKMAEFSLKKRGVLDKPWTATLVANGAKDSQVPISDVYITLEHGSPKYAWVRPDGGHVAMGPGYSLDRIYRESIMPWLVEQFASGGASGEVKPK